MNLHQILLSAMSQFVQCSNDKRGNYKLNIPKFIALEKYKFIQLFNKSYIKFISIDIDQKDIKKYETIADVYYDILNKGLPTPTIIVKTDNGFHIHWYLDKSVFINNKIEYNKYEQVRSYFNDILNGDKNFARFIVRNPLKHEYFYTGELYNSINDFEKYFDLTKINNQTKKEKNKIVRNKINWNEVKVGERNQILYSYLRDFMFQNYETLSYKAFEKEAIRVNSLIPIPLNENEVLSTVKSVYKFVEKNYNPNYVSKKRVEFNKKLAKDKQNKTLEKIKDNIIKNYNKLSIIKIFMKKYTIYSLSKILKVDRKTIKKYYDYILNLIKNIILSMKNKVKSIVDFNNKNYFYLFDLNQQVRIIDDS